jgi:peptidoglycan/LPS O-acetylase OafA/YrhL
MNKLPGLQGLRAISVLLVIAAHLVQQGTVPLPEGWSERLMPVLMDASHLGVNIFFVISGFLITSLLLYEEESKGKVSIGNFFMRRTLRVFPAYYFLLFVYFILQVCGVIAISGWSWLTAITYTKYLNWGRDWLTAHAWSLSIEEHFYLTWPFVFALLKRHRTIFCTVIVVAVPILKLVAFHTPFLTERYVQLSLTIFFRCDAIAIGCLLALNGQKLRDFVKGRESAVALGSMILLVSILCFSLPFSCLGPVAENLNILLGTTVGSISNASISLFILCCVCPKEAWWHWALNNPLVERIGVLSYSLYLWQQFYVNKTDYWVNQFPQNIVLLFATAFLSYRLIEKPFLKLKSYFS